MKRQRRHSRCASSALDLVDRVPPYKKTFAIFTTLRTHPAAVGARNRSAAAAAAANAAAAPANKPPQVGFAAPAGLQIASSLSRRGLRCPGTAPRRGLRSQPRHEVKTLGYSQHTCQAILALCK